MDDEAVAYEESIGTLRALDPAMADAMEDWYRLACFDAQLEGIRRRGERLAKEMAEMVEAHPEAKDWTFEV
jgi:hypothetical protein